jgi:hypothetical protein
MLARQSWESLSGNDFESLHYNGKMFEPEAGFNTATQIAHCTMTTRVPLELTGECVKYNMAGRITSLSLATQ